MTSVNGHYTPISRMRNSGHLANDKLTRKKQISDDVFAAIDADLIERDKLRMELEQLQADIAEKRDKIARLQLKCMSAKHGVSRATIIISKAALVKSGKVKT